MSVHLTPTPLTYELVPTRLFVILYISLIKLVTWPLTSSLFSHHAWQSACSVSSRSPQASRARCFVDPLTLCQHSLGCITITVLARTLSPRALSMMCLPCHSFTGTLIYPVTMHNITDMTWHSMTWHSMAWHGSVHSRRDAHPAQHGAIIIERVVSCCACCSVWHHDEDGSIVHVHQPHIAIIQSWIVSAWPTVREPMQESRWGVRSWSQESLEARLEFSRI